MSTHDDYPETQGPTTEQLRALSVVQPDSDSFRLSGNESDLLFVAGRVMRLLDPDLQTEQVIDYIEAIKQGEVRPTSGLFAVSMVHVSQRDKEAPVEHTLLVSNRNMRGYRPVQAQLEKAVAGALNPDEVVD